MTYYVYKLIDPRNGLPFYVGKGQGRRAWEHQRRVEAGVCGGNARKVSKIREILISGHDVEVEIVADYDLESDALDHEFRLVDLHPTLTNVMPGGGAGPSMSPEQREKRRVARKARVDALRAKEREIKTASQSARKRAVLCALPNASLHVAEIGDWVADRQKAAEAGPPRGFALDLLKAQAVRERNKRRRFTRRQCVKRNRLAAKAAEPAAT
jgi:hypothetical protein